MLRLGILVCGLILASCGEETTSQANFAGPANELYDDQIVVDSQGVLRVRSVRAEGEVEYEFQLDNILGDDDRSFPNIAVTYEGGDLTCRVKSISLSGPGWLGGSEYRVVVRWHLSQQSPKFHECLVVVRDANDVNSYVHQLIRVNPIQIAVPAQLF